MRIFIVRSRNLAKLQLHVFQLRTCVPFTSLSARGALVRRCRILRFVWVACFTGVVTVPGKNPSLSPCVECAAMRGRGCSSVVWLSAFGPKSSCTNWLAFAWRERRRCWRKVAKWFNIYIYEQQLSTIKGVLPRKDWEIKGHPPVSGLQVWNDGVGSNWIWFESEFNDTLFSN